MTVAEQTQQTPHLLESTDKTIEALLDDPSIFEALEPSQMLRVQKFLKNATPRPEHKEEFPWLLGLMSENIEAATGHKTRVTQKSGGDTRLEQIMALREEGKTLKQIGDIMGLSGPRVSGLLRGK